MLHYILYLMILAMGSSLGGKKLELALTIMSSNVTLLFRTGTIGAAESQRGRPDIMISWQRGLELAGNVGFGEVKRIQEASNSYAISQDLVRLGDFAKAAIMIGEAEACLTIQAVGMFLACCKYLVIAY